MVQATFTVSGADFNAEIFEQIKNFINGKGQNFEVFIKVKTIETREEMRSRIEKAMDDTEMGLGKNSVFVAGEDFEKFMNELQTKSKKDE